MVRVVMNGLSGFLQEFLSKIALAGHTIVAKDLSVKLLTGVGCDSNREKCLVRWLPFVIPANRHGPRGHNDA
jgi:hypothetical protein